MPKNYMNNSQASEIMKFISDTMKFPIMGAGGGFAPIGTINFFDATTAPLGWLACDGSIHNISDYPDLATFYASQHGASNFYGGNGTTTFAVPNLQGEFLRGAGTNGHTNQGNGGSVGEHQDATEHVHFYSFKNGSIGCFSNDANGNYTELKTDSYINGTSKNISVGANFNENDTIQRFTSRPTNTSFLICVKATVSGDANAHQYSTDEQVVGMDEDGKYIYEKTITGLNIRLNWAQQYCADSSEFDPLIQNVGIVYSCNARCNGSSDSDLNTTTNLPIILKRMNSNGKWKFRSYDDYIVKEVTIQYTKTQ